MEEFKNLGSFDPRSCLSGKISRIHRLTATIFRKYMAPFYVTNSQVSLLFVLTKHTTLTQRQLSKIVRLEKSSLHRNLKRLIAQEYLDKGQYPQIAITEKGKKLVNAIVPEWEKAMSELREIIGQDGELSIDLIHNKLTTKA